MLPQWVVLLDNPQQVDHGDYVSCWILTRTLQPSNPHCSEESANLSRTTHWLLHHDRLLPSGRWRGTGSVSGELEGQVVAIVCLVSPSFGSSRCLFRQLLLVFRCGCAKKRLVSFEASCLVLYMDQVMFSCQLLCEHFSRFLVC